MSLSNTATPIYYGQFRDRVMAGDIPVCKEISMEMNRIDQLIDNPGIYYDDKAVIGFVKYCENELTLTDGSDLTLLDTFKLWAEEIFGWYYFVERSIYQPSKDNHGGRYIRKMVKKRLINKQYLIVARGAAKSMYGSCIQSFFLNVNSKTTQQITTAPTMKQAEEVMSPIRTSITRARGPLFKFLTEGSLQNTTGSRANRVKLASTKKGIENFLTGSIIEVRPMSIDKLQGLRPMVSTVDEWLSGDIREDVVGAIEQGASKLEDYLIIAMSSEGTVRNSSGDTIKMELLDILKGEYLNPHVSIWYYKLDDVQEVNDPSTWLKANPNLGRTVSYETYQLDVERAENAPATRNDILAKRFGIPMEGYTYFFTYEETVVHRHRSFWSMPCSLGLDLSQGDDFCAFTFLFPLSNGSYGVKTRSYISSLTLMRLPGASFLLVDWSDLGQFFWIFVGAGVFRAFTPFCERSSLFTSAQPLLRALIPFCERSSLFVSAQSLLRAPSLFCERSSLFASAQSLLRAPNLFCERSSLFASAQSLLRAPNLFCERSSLFASAQPSVIHLIRYLTLLPVPLTSSEYFFSSLLIT